MIKEFQYYINENLVKKMTPNIEEAHSLMDKAFERLDYVKKQHVDKSTATFIFEDVYECLREGAQSLMTLKGYKPYSHEALVAFLKEFYNISDYVLSKFNNYRILRNKCIYDASVISIPTFEEALRFAVSFLPELKKIFEKEVEEGV